MKVVTSSEMAEIDSLTINQYGIPSLVLMERAALAVVKHILKPKIDYMVNPFGHCEASAGCRSNLVSEIATGTSFPCNDNSERERKRVIVLAGPGNNGGDGVAVARIIKNKATDEEKIDIKVFQLFPEDKLSEDCKTQLRIAKNFGVEVIEDYPSKSDISHADLIVDAIFGTGLKRELEGSIADLVNTLNSFKRTVVAVDIPSGISSDTGEVLGTAVKATLTVTFGLPKRGHLLFPGRDYVGRLFVEDIGFPQELLNSEKIKVELIDEKLARSLLPLRPAYSHKGTYGHVLVIAGSVGKTGAAMMPAKSCLRAGSGLVTIAVPACLKVVFQSKVLEEMLLPLPCNIQTLSKQAIPEIKEFLNEKADVVAFGPGVGINDDTEEILKFLLTESPCPVVIDADGITLLSRNPEILKNAKPETVITPHPGELSRLIKISVKEIERRRIEIAQSVAKEFGTVVVLKGVPTVVASSDGRAFLNTTGNPGMATGGSGDVLTGIIASLIGQRLNVFQASVLGVYIHGLSGDIASRDKGYHGLVAGDIIESLPKAFIKLNEIH